MQLDDTVLQCFKPARVFKDNEARINSIDFHRTEDLLVTAGDDDAINVYNTQTAQVQKTLLSKKYGVANISFTHDPNSVIYSSNKVRSPGSCQPQLHTSSCVRAYCQQQLGPADGGRAG